MAARVRSGTKLQLSVDVRNAKVSHQRGLPHHHVVVLVERLDQVVIVDLKAVVHAVAPAAGLGARHRLVLHEVGGVDIVSVVAVAVEIHIKGLVVGVLEALEVVWAHHRRVVGFFLDERRRGRPVVVSLGELHCEEG